MPEDVAHRRRQVLELRRDGLSFHEIAERVGYADHTGAYRAYEAALKEIPREAVEGLRAQTAERYNMVIEESKRVIAAMLPLVEGGGKQATYAARCVADAHKQILDAERDRAKVFGLEAPKQIVQEVNVKTTQEDVLSKLARLATSIGTGEAHQEPKSN